MRITTTIRASTIYHQHRVPLRDLSSRSHNSAAEQGIERYGQYANEGEHVGGGMDMGGLVGVAEGEVGVQGQYRACSGRATCRAVHVFVRFFFQAEDGIRDVAVTGVQTCALPI